VELSGQNLPTDHNHSRCARLDRGRQLKMTKRILRRRRRIPECCKADGLDSCEVVNSCWRSGRQGPDEIYESVARDRNPLSYPNNGVCDSSCVSRTRCVKEEHGGARLANKPVQNC
jgi:hypothetical protein